TGSCRTSSRGTTGARRRCAEGTIKSRRRAVIGRPRRPRGQRGRMSPDFIKRKILLLGDASVGKTSLIRRFVVDKFSDDYITTIGTKVTKKDLRFDQGNRTVDLSMMIWDVLGQKGYKGIQESAFRGARGVILVFDLTRPETKASFD